MLIHVEKNNLLGPGLELISYLLIRKQPLGTWIFFINVFRVVFTLVDKKTTSWDLFLITVNNASSWLIRKRLIGTWFILINASRVDFTLVDKKTTSWDLDTIINVFRVVFTLVDKKTTSWDLDILYQCI